MLLDGRYAPLTFAIGYIRADLEVAVAAMENWRKKQVHGLSVRHLDDSTNLETALKFLDPLSIPRTRELLLETKTRLWTAYFDNGANGADPSSTVGHLAQVLGCDAVALRCIPRTSPAMYATVQMEIFGPQNLDFLNYVRSISATDDGGKWRFVVAGEPQPFEVPEMYRSRKVRDRFTPAMLAQYAQALGIEVFDPRYYGNRGCLFTYRYAGTPPNEITLHARQNQLRESRV